ncbi:MAG TPA: LapA family protein [Gammaproteobacteria bacterium]|nr:LapA family protein [Gammaproteobacteria bacterium]
MKRLITSIILLLVLVVGIYFGLLNAEKVTINYYFGSYELPLSLVMVISVLVGALLGAIASIGIVFRMRKRISRLKREVGERQRELANTRALADGGQGQQA